MEEAMMKSKRPTHISKVGHSHPQGHKRGLPQRGREGQGASLRRQKTGYFFRIHAEGRPGW